jgi:hypothetical protein
MDDARVDAVVMVPVAKTDLVRRVVRPMVRAEDDVMHFEARASGAPGRLAAVVVALEDLAFHRTTRRIEGEPNARRDVDEEGEHDPIGHGTAALVSTRAERIPVVVEFLWKPETYASPGGVRTEFAAPADGGLAAEVERIGADGESEPVEETFEATHGARIGRGIFRNAVHRAKTFAAE